jgi:CHAD domain-containing protein
MPHAIEQETGKWLVGVSPNEPISLAATLAVSARLKFVAACLPLAAYSAEEDAEFVHQLRVGSRRAAAAIVAFGDCLPKRRTRKMRRGLKRIRREAGAARDLDVLLSRLAKSQVPFSAGELEEVQRYLQDRRCEAQHPILSRAKELPPRKLDRKLTRLVRRIHWRGVETEPTISQAARQQMSDVASEFDEAAQAADDGSMETLHGLRIAGKRLRYTIELFAGVAANPLREHVYPLIEELQDRLGTINDQVAAERYYQTCAQSALTPGLKGSFNRLANHELQAISQSLDAFRRWWSPHRCQEIHAGATSAFPPPSAA